MVPDIAVQKRKVQSSPNGAPPSTPSPDSAASSPESQGGRPVRRPVLARNGHHQPHPLTRHKPNHLDDDTQSLPINLIRRELLARMGQNESMIIIGETGCGKTTQIPKLALEHFGRRAMIGVTQPRRVAAISIAARVASEMRCAVGDLVGYSVRFEDHTGPHTAIKYMTDGILLREAISDPLLSRYGLVILDEAHERTVHTDILFGVVKKALRLRNAKRAEGDRGQHWPLKLILMSATMDVDHLAAYFRHAPVYYVAGRTHPIEVFYAAHKQTDYVLAALTTVCQIHQAEDELEEGRREGCPLTPPIGGDILVFCTGQEEIESMASTVKDLLPELGSMKTTSGVVKSLKTYPLYAALPTAQQQAVFSRSPADCFRRVILATNIAETSLTIPNIRYVIDTGKVKCRVFSAKTGFEVMRVEDISRAQAAQRSGRAGRLAAGSCYRLYTRHHYKAMRRFPLPEIQKCNLASVLLQMLAIGIADVKNFEFVDSPPADNIDRSLRELLAMRAIERQPDSPPDHFRLTATGQKMVTFPVDPRFAALILASNEYGCTDEILTIVSMLSVDNVFYVAGAHRETALSAHRKFASPEGDLIQLLHVFRKFREARQSVAWCEENYLRPVQLRKAVEIRRQLAQLCLRLHIPPHSAPSSLATRRCLALGAGLGVGLGANVAVLQREGHYQVLEVGGQREHTPCQPVHIHPSSCLSHSTARPETLLFTELVHTSKTYMRNVCLVQQDWFLPGDSSHAAPA